MAVRWLFITIFQNGRQFWREPIGSFGEKWRAGRLGLEAAKFVGKTTGIVLEYFRPRKERREFRVILTKQEGRGNKERDLIKGE